MYIPTYAHTPSYTNTHILAAHIQVHTHSSVHLCTHSHPLHPHEHTQGSAICTHAQIHIQICPYQSGSPWFTHIPVPSKQNIYIQVHVKTHTRQYKLMPKLTDGIQTHSHNECSDTGVCTLTPMTPHLGTSRQPAAHGSRQVWKQGLAQAS